MEERRKHLRFETLNLVYYVVRGDGSYLTQDMGRTIDASESGLLMETRVPLIEGLQIQMDIGFANTILSFTGMVIHSRTSETGMHLSGIEFDSLDPEQRNNLVKYLQQFKPEVP
ncbi:MAG: PilZ domain-containing protein [Desulfuromonadaceae bacterium]|nr:PilZ domain-containing protein [Desulfuromonas sp.]MDY0184567.1 PilZ domain-containing protein [Desulfuromonadaceae bacterium]